MGRLRRGLTTRRPNDLLKELIRNAIRGFNWGLSITSRNFVNAVLLLSLHRGERGHTMKLVVGRKGNGPERRPVTTMRYDILRRLDMKSFRGIMGVDEIGSRGGDVRTGDAIDVIDNIEKLNRIPTIAGSAMQIRHRGGGGHPWNFGG